MSRRAIEGTSRPKFVIVPLVILLIVSSVCAFSQPAPAIPSLRSFQWRDLIEMQPAEFSWHVVVDLFPGWWRRVEFNPSSRIAMTNAKLTKIVMASNGVRGWAIGSGGLILRTVDGGRNWTEGRAGNVIETLVSVAATSGGGELVALGEKGAILRSADGGETWSSDGGSHFERGYVGASPTSDGRNVLVLGEESWGRLGVERGGGWSPLRPIGAAEHNLTALASSDQKLWAVGKSGAIVTSMDGGATWVPHPVPDVRSALNAVAAVPDGTKAWCVGDEGVLLVTKDGGQSWSRRKSEVAGDLLSVAISSDGNIVWAVGRDGIVLLSDDGGNSWKSAKIGVEENFTGVAITPNGLNAWLVSGNGSILHSEDRGEHWDMQVFGAGMTFNHVVPSPEKRSFYLTDEAGGVFASQDGGGTWRREFSQPGRVLKSLALAEGGKAWAIDQQGALLSTSDAGRHWAPIDLGSGGSLLAVASSRDGDHVLAVGRSGRIVVKSGDTWSEESSGAGEDLDGVAVAPDGEAEWIVGHKGTILIHQKSGPWRSLSYRGDAIDSAANIVLSSDGRKVVANWAGGMVSVLRNEGGAWKRSNSRKEETKVGQIVAPGDGAILWAVGASGRLYRSDNDGNDWIEATTPTGGVDPTVFLSSIAMTSDGAIMLAAGRNGSLYRRSGEERWGEVSLSEEGGAYYGFPAPYYWLCLPIILWFSFKGWVFHPHEKVNKAFESDGPIEEPSEDRFDTRRRAKSLARMLGNGDTRSPFSIAIAGQWGIGKSSLMNLLGWELRRQGFPVVNFNAWHHADDTQILASLFCTLRDEGLSGLSLVERLLFPFNVLARRLGRYWHFIMLFAIVAVVSSALLGSGGKSFDEELMRTRLEQQRDGDRLSINAAYQGENGKWIRVRNGLIWYESWDYGANWTSVSAAAADFACSDPLTVRCVDEWEIDFYGKLRKKEGGGSVLADAVVATALASHRVDAKHTLLWVGDDQGGVWRSADAGRSWSHMQLLEKEEVAGLGFYQDNRTGWLITRAGKIYASMDAGAHWDRTGLFRVSVPRPPTLWEYADLVYHHFPSDASWVSIAKLSLFLAALLLTGLLVADAGPLSRIRSPLLGAFRFLTGRAGREDFEGDAGFRHRFQREFELYCKACLRRPVIIIDDLDRCPPSKIEAVLEAVNFLASGTERHCYVILGLDLEKVKAMLAMSTVGIVKELKDKEGEPQTAYDYATSYLGKIINLIIKLPPLGGEQVNK